MKESQAEIRAIQAKLQALQLGHSSLRQPATAIDPPVASRPPAAVLSSGKVASDAGRGDRPQEGQRPRRPAEGVAAKQDSGRPVVSEPPQRQLQPLHLPESPASLLTETLQRLKAQAERVNQLSAEQEVALLELKALAEQADRDRKTLAQSDFETDADFDEDIPAWECLETVVPLVERDDIGTFVVTTRSVDLFRAEREAVLIAQTLRHRLAESAAPQTSTFQSSTVQKSIRPASKRKSEAFYPSSEESDWGQLLLGKISSLLQGRRARRPALRRRQPAPTLTVQDAALWIIGAVVVRKGLDLLLAAVPMLWIPVVGLILISAAIAIYRTTFTPEFGFTWGYRLFLVMLGLLIGGRL